MLRRVSVVLLLSALAHAQDALAKLFDPADPRFGLQTYGGVQFRKMSRDRRLVAKGIDPELWRDPPPFSDRLAQANNIPGPWDEIVPRTALSEIQ